MMTTKQMRILITLANCPIVSTDMIYKYFEENGSPEKRASEQLRVLWNQKLVEKQARSMGKTFLWRLSKKGRDLMGVTRPPVAFNTPKLEHILEIGKCYQWLAENGNLEEWEYEPHYRIDEKYKYCPDAYCKWEGKRYFIEVQLSYLSADRWKGKWRMAEEFFKGPFKKASFQNNPAKILKPHILCIAAGNPTLSENVKNITVLKSIEQLKELQRI